MNHAFEAFAEWYVAYGYPILVLGVFLENAGVPVPGETAVLVAGFLASPAGGALVWASSMGLLGYVFGQSWQLLHHWLGWGSWMILGGAVLLVALRHLRLRLRQRARPGIRPAADRSPPAPHGSPR